MMGMYSSLRWFPFLAFLLALPAAPQVSAGLATVDSAVVISSGSSRSTDNAPASQLTAEQRGDRLFLGQQYQAAIQAYGQVAQASAVLWNKMGISYQMLDSLKDAVRCYKESLKLQPTDDKVINNLATAEEELGDFPAAERNYRKALDLNPNNAQILKNLGTNLLMQGDYDRGAATYKKALSIDPHILDARFEREVTEPEAVQSVGAVNYAKARSCAQVGLTDCALTYLRLAFNEGSATVKKVDNDANFATMRGTPALAHILAEQR